MSAVGTIITENLSYPTMSDFKVVGESGDLWAIQPIDKDPDTAPVYWYVKDELLRTFKIKETK